MGNSEIRNNNLIISANYRYSTVHENSVLSTSVVVVYGEVYLCTERGVETMSRLRDTVLLIGQ